jgi:hypothetical protein
VGVCGWSVVKVELLLIFAILNFPSIYRDNSHANTPTHTQHTTYHPHEDYVIRLPETKLDDGLEHPEKTFGQVLSIDWKDTGMISVRWNDHKRLPISPLFLVRAVEEMPSDAEEEDEEDEDGLYASGSDDEDDSAGSSDRGASSDAGSEREVSSSEEEEAEEEQVEEEDAGGEEEEGEKRVNAQANREGTSSTSTSRGVQANAHDDRDRFPASYSSFRLLESHPGVCTCWLVGWL